MKITQQGKELLFSKDITARQQQVIDSLLENEPNKNKDIGRTLSIGEMAVKAQFTKIYRRLNVKSRTGLIKFLTPYIEQKSE